MAKFGEKLRKVRKSMGLSQENFARMIGVTFVTVNRWERGHFKPSPLAMANLISFLPQYFKESKSTTPG